VAIAHQVVYDQGRKVRPGSSVFDPADLLDDIKRAAPGAGLFSDSIDHN